MDGHEIGYAIAKQIPSMESGFTVITDYGSIVVESFFSEQEKQFLSSAFREVFEKKRYALISERE